MDGLDRGRRQALPALFDHGTNLTAPRSWTGSSRGLVGQRKTPQLRSRGRPLPSCSGPHGAEVFDAAGATAPGRWPVGSQRAGGRRPGRARSGAGSLRRPRAQSSCSPPAASRHRRVHAQRAAGCALPARRPAPRSDERPVEELVRDAERDGARACREALRRDGVLPRLRAPALPGRGSACRGTAGARRAAPDRSRGADCRVRAAGWGVRPVWTSRSSPSPGTPALRGRRVRLFPLDRSAGWAAHAFEPGSRRKLIRRGPLHQGRSRPQRSASASSFVTVYQLRAVAATPSRRLGE